MSVTFSLSTMPSGGGGVVWSSFSAGSVKTFEAYRTCVHTVDSSKTKASETVSPTTSAVVMLTVGTTLPIFRVRMNSRTPCRFVRAENPNGPKMADSRNCPKLVGSVMRAAKRVSGPSWSTIHCHDPTPRPASLLYGMLTES